LACAGQVGLPLGRVARDFGEALRFMAAMRSAVSVLTWFGLPRVDLRGGREPALGSSS
jgi:hypothetical protein